MRGGARVLLVARTSGRIAGALMAVVERVITPPPDDADAALIAAEQERYYLRAATGAWCARCKDDVDKCPEYPRADALREFVDKCNPPRAIAAMSLYELARNLLTEDTP